MNGKRVVLTLPKQKREIVRKALESYKLNTENSPVKGKKLKQVIEDLDELILISDAEIIISFELKDFLGFEKNHGKKFPSFEE